MHLPLGTVLRGFGRENPARGSARQARESSSLTHGGPHDGLLPSGASWMADQGVGDRTRSAVQNVAVNRGRDHVPMAEQLVDRDGHARRARLDPHCSRPGHGRTRQSTRDHHPHAQQRGWWGQLWQCQPTTGWKAPAAMAWRTSATRRKRRRLGERPPPKVVSPATFPVTPARDNRAMTIEPGSLALGGRLIDDPDRAGTLLIRPSGCARTACSG